jgi:hypothetical protein
MRQIGNWPSGVIIHCLAQCQPAIASMPVS